MTRRWPGIVRIGRRRVGGGAPCFVIAEAGVNHNGRMDYARRLVNAAARAGADAVKFQAFDPDLLVEAGADRAPYQRDAGDSDQREMLRALVLDPNQLRELARYARSRGLMFLATPFDETSLAALVRIRVPALKLGSGEVTNPFLLRAAAASGRPVLLSTGMSTFDEVDGALRELRKAGCRSLVLFHCVSAYPAPFDSLNLRAIPRMAARYGAPVGFSDHTLGTTAPVAAVAIGAAIIEKHLTLDRALPGPDHAASLEPSEFSAMVDAIRSTQDALGDGQKRCTASERDNIRHVRRSCAAAVSLCAGSRIRREHLTAKRPETGVPAIDADRLIGRRLRRDVPAGAIIRWEAVER